MKSIPREILKEVIREFAERGAAELPDGQVINVRDVRAIIVEGDEAHIYVHDETPPPGRYALMIVVLRPSISYSYEVLFMPHMSTAQDVATQEAPTQEADLLKGITLPEWAVGVFASESGIYPVKRVKTGFMYKERWKPLTVEEGHPLGGLVNVVVLKNGEKMEVKRIERKGDVVYITV